MGESGLYSEMASTTVKGADLISIWNHLPVWGQVCGILIGGVLVHLIIQRFILRGLRKMTEATDNDLDDRLFQFLSKFYIFILLVVVVALILRANGIAITPILASAGIMGVALGLAAKETLADILSGISLIADRPIRIGDRVKLDRIGSHWGAWGDVVDIGIRRTQIRNTDGVIVNYPNSLLATSTITNFSYEEEPVRVRVRFQVGYEEDLDAVQELTVAAIENTEGVMPGTAECVVRSLWDDNGGHQLSGVLMEGRYRLEDVRTRTRVRSLTLKFILKALREAGISPAVAQVRMGGDLV